MRDEQKQREYDVNLAISTQERYRCRSESLLAEKLEIGYGWDSAYSKQIADLVFVGARTENTTPATTSDTHLLETICELRNNDQLITCTPKSTS